MVQRQMGPGMIVQQQEEVASKEKCMEEETTLDAVIEKGMGAGQEIVFERMSEQRPKQIPGDVILTIRQKQHSTFTRQGNDLHASLTISLREALLGFERTMAHLDGHEVKVRAAKVTKPGDVIKVRGEGMPLHNFASEFGDLYVTITIAFPESLTEEQAGVMTAHF